MKKYIFKILFGVIISCIVFIGFLYMNNDIGISSSNLEANIRSSQKIQDDWIVEGDISDTMAAFISYPKNMDDHTFSVYVNRSGLSFGYFFRGGGDLSIVEKEIMEYTVDGYSERAFISMNQQKVAKLTIDDGNSVQDIEIDINKPFAIVLPTNAGSIIFYDVNGNIVDYQNERL